MNLKQQELINDILQERLKQRERNIPHLRLPIVHIPLETTSPCQKDQKL